MPKETVVFFRALRREWAWIVIPIVTGMCVALLATSLTHSNQSASVDLVVRSTNPTDDPQRVLRTQSRIILSDSVLQPVAAQGTYGSLATIRAHVRALPFADSDIIRVVANGRTAQQASALDNAVVASYQNLVAVTMNQAAPPASDGASSAPPTPLGLAPITLIGGQGQTSTSKLKLGIKYGLAGAIIGALVGIAALLIRVRLDERVWDEGQLRELFPFPIFSVLEADPRRPKRPKGSSNRFSVASVERLRILLAHHFEGKSQSRFGLSSINDSQTQAFLAGQLAFSSAGSRARTLLVGCDLREQVLSEFIPNAESKTTFVNLINATEDNEHESKRIIETVDQELSQPDTLLFLPSGTSEMAPEHFLSSPEATSVLEHIGTSFDMVILQSPSTENADAAIVARGCDLFLIIVELGEVRSEELRRSAELLGAVRCPVVVILINNVTRHPRASSGAQVR